MGCLYTSGVQIEQKGGVFRGFVSEGWQEQAGRGAGEKEP
jgi:hypothetical protein